MMMKRNVFFTVMLFAFATIDAFAADVVARPTMNPSSRASIARIPTIAQQLSNTTNTTTNTETTNTESVIVDSVVETTVVEPVKPVESKSVEIENKSSYFSDILDAAMTSGSDSAGGDLAAQVRAQRAALDVALSAPGVSSSSHSGCDTGLRQCMTEKCGNDFIKCASDTDTLFGTKLDSCRRNLKCNANEFKLFSAEIKADRAAAIKMKSFNDIINCGKNYDTCIVGQCGTTYSKCIGKTAGDLAISNCATIERNCAAMDNGLAARTLNVFATLRQTAEKQISADEKKLYAMRDQMKTICTRLGAMFDERSLDCVYTVNFYAGGDSTLYASKKAYAGSTFDCTPNWFGVDITTFKENAYRLTRAQSSASSSVLGSGVGMAVGSITSGAIDRAVERHDADIAVKRAECEREPGKKWNSFLNTCVKDNNAKKTGTSGGDNNASQPQGGNQGGDNGAQGDTGGEQGEGQQG